MRSLDNESVFLPGKEEKRIKQRRDKQGFLTRPGKKDTVNATGRINQRFLHLKESCFAESRINWKRG